MGVVAFDPVVEVVVVLMVTLRQPRDDEPADVGVWVAPDSTTPLAGLYLK